MDNGKLRMDNYPLSILHYQFIIALLLAFFSLVAMGGLYNWDVAARRGMSPILPEPIAGGGAELGLNVYLNQYDDDELDAQLAAIAASGIRIIKQPFFYSPAFDWAESDRIINAAIAHDLHIVPLLDGDPNDGFALVETAVFSHFAADFATRYGETMDEYIIWDEPNLSSHWGGQPVNANAYAALLMETAVAIRRADPDAIIIAAPLAPTVETSGDNLADPIYLQQLYEAGAAAAFDRVMAKPYGFDHPPDDRTVDINRLNFSRAILLREVMERNGDGGIALMAGNFGWNHLPDGWTGDPSLWGNVTAEQQTVYTYNAIARARAEWAWMGTLFLENWQPAAPADDPHWGFAVTTNPELVEGWPAFTERSSTSSDLVAMTGFHLADPADPAQTFTGDWSFSPDFGADIGESGDSATFDFVGTAVGLRVRRADFRARFYVTVDGEPANRLPQDERGAFLILTSPDPNDDYITTELVADNLTLTGGHTLRITADRGWDQWALHGFSVGYAPPTRGYGWAMGLLGVTAVLSLIFAFFAAKRARWDGIFARFHALGEGWQMVITAVTAATVAVTGWLTWGEQAAGLYRRLPDSGQLALTAAAAALFYVAPSFYLYAAALSLLFLLIFLRPAWGIALIALVIPFYVNHNNALTLLAKPMLGYRFSPVELFTLITFGAWLARTTVQRSWRNRRLLWTDGAVLALVTVAIFSLFFTERLDVAVNELRVVIIEPALFYLLLRGGRLTKKELWTVLDAFVLGGLTIALYGLWQYGFDRANLITAEGGLMRLRSIYGSPNNVALYLGRVMPLAAAVLLLGNGTQIGRIFKINADGKLDKPIRLNLSFLRRQESTPLKRRLLYGAALLPMGAAFLLTFSKGGILLAAPAAGMFVFWRWQKGNGRLTYPYLIALILIGGLLLAGAMQIPSLAGRLDPRGGTGLFRLNLWKSSVNMVRERPLTGVGLDNFLYAYRGRHIMEAAWQEPNLNHPHNILLDFSTRLGLLGLAAGSWLIAALGWNLWKATPSPVWRPVVVGFGGSLIAMLIHGLVDHSFFLPDLAYAFYLMLGTAVWIKTTEGMSS